MEIYVFVIYLLYIYSEVHPVPTARRPLIRLSVCGLSSPFVAFRLNPPPGLGLWARTLKFIDPGL